MRKLFLAVTVVFLLPPALTAHVNSPDVYFDGNAGPYHLLITVRPPAVVPGIARITIRSADPDVDEIRILPLRMVGVASRLAPTPDTARRSSADSQLYTGQLWIMSRGSWKVQVDVAGKRGAGQMAVPLPAVSTSSTSMQATLGILLAVLGLALCAGFVGIIGAASRDADLPPGDQPPAEKTRLSRLRMTITTAFVVIALVAANHWWGLEARANARLNYKLPRVQASLNGHTLRLELENPNATEMGRFGTIPPDRIELTDLIKDHGHLMHLFLVRVPDMNSFWHFHPDQVGEGQFTMTLPVLPAGHYRIYADVVHSTGFPETQVGEIDVPKETIPETVDRPTRPGEWLGGDDSGIADAAASEKISPLSGGYRMVWLRDEAPLNANQPFWFRFRVEDKDGKPATDLEPYMGMAGHAVFISSDGGAFAHVHPAGSVSMAAVDIAAGRAPSLSSSDMSAMPGMQHDHQGAEVSFPYGFPRPGDYRIFVQIKRGGHVETGSFLAQAH